MEITPKTINCGTVVTQNSILQTHTPSNIQADTLFTFIGKLEYFLPYIQNHCIYPRYCDEDISYLHIEGLEKVYIPMKCFCDINFHRLSHHLDFYGHYGLAFSKEWGMRNSIQPIHYINPTSSLCKDFSETFSRVIKSDNTDDQTLETFLKSYMIHELMYYKPYEGVIKNRVTQKMQNKCFMEECEWRYIPDLSNTDFPQIYYDNTIINAGVINDSSNALVRVPSVALNYEYEDLKYIIIKTADDFDRLIDVIDKLNVNVHTRNELISKIIIWDKSRSDF